MIFPIKTDYQMSIRPWVNYSLIIANVLIFLMGYNGMTAAGMSRIDLLMLRPDPPQMLQFFTAMFLHASWMHLIGNMVFLWVFGNAINDRFGNLGYIAFYLAGGVVSGVGYLTFSGQVPSLGASGAISAVTGAYLVLLPRVRLTVLAWIIFIQVFEMSSLFFLAIQFAFNMWMSVGKLGGANIGGGVAYWAHSSGYLFGIGVAAALLVLRILPRDTFDLLNLIRSGWRRHEYRKMAAKGFDPFSQTRVSKSPGKSRRVHAKTVETATPDSPAVREMKLRSEISQACGRHDLQTASAKYLQLIQIADDAILGRSQQLDVANQLMSTDRQAQAADAYERFLQHYSQYEHIADIHLMLGILYGRYLHQYDRAANYLEKAAAKLEDPKKVELAKADLAMVRRKKAH